MTDFIREVDEDFRRDRAIAQFRRFQWPILALAVLIVVATGAWRWIETSRQRAAEAAGARYEKAAALARDGKADEAAAALKAIATDGPPGYAVLARFRAAADLGGRDPKAAATLYDGLAADAAIPSGLQELARLRAAVLRLDGADPAEARRMLEPLATPNSPFRASAREWLALRALADNKLDEAGRWFDLLVTDPGTPPDLRGRAETFQGLIAGGAAPP